MAAQDGHTLHNSR